MISYTVLSYGTVPANRSKSMPGIIGHQNPSVKWAMTPRVAAAYD